MRTIAIFVIVVILVILIRDHIWFMDAENDDESEDERDCYHTGDW